MIRIPLLKLSGYDAVELVEAQRLFATLAEARAVIERWRIDYNHVRPHSAHGGLTPEAVRLNPAAVRLRNLISSAARPLPSAKQIGYQPPGLS